MRFGVGGVDELARNKAPRGLTRQLFRLGNGAFHALGTFGENDFSAVGLQQFATFRAHGFRHRKNGTVTFARGNACQTDAGVAACGFNDDAAGFEKSFFLGIFDHRKRNTVLDAASRVKEFELDENSCL